LEIVLTATLTFHPLDNADCTHFDLADGRKMLHADMKNRDDPWVGALIFRWNSKLTFALRSLTIVRLSASPISTTIIAAGPGDFFWLEPGARPSSKSGWKRTASR
jgi:hypothetical protein